MTASVFYTYILLCNNAALYTGHTANLVRRLEWHKKGWGSQLTRILNDVQLVWYESHSSREAAMRRERQLKGWTRKKKWALIKVDLDLLKS